MSKSTLFQSCLGVNSEDGVSYSRAERSASDEARTSDPSMSSRAFYATRLILDDGWGFRTDRACVNHTYSYLEEP